MSKLYTRIILALTLALAGFLRFFTPFGYPAVSNRDYWYDEAFTGILLKASWLDMNRMIFADVHPPLYYWLTKLWASMFEYSPFGIRSFSVVMGLASIFSIYWVGRKMFNDRVGIFAAILTAISPFAIEYSQEARMYALFGLLMLWAVYFFYLALTTEEKKNWLLWGIFCGLSFYTHYLALFFFVMFYVAYVLFQWQAQNETQQEKRPTLRERINIFFGQKNFWLGVGVIILFFASWIKIFIAHISKGNLGWIDPAQLSDIPKTLQIFFFGHPAGTGGVPWSNEFRMIFDGSSVGLLILVLMVGLFVGAWLMDWKRKEFLILATLSFGTFIFLIIASQFNIKLYVARYFMPAALFVYLLFAALIEEVFEKRWVWLVVLGVYVGLLLLLKPITFSADWSQIHAARADLLKPGQLVLTSNAFDYSTARYYFGEDKVRYYNKNNPNEDFSGWVVVGNHNRITDPQEITKNKDNFLIVDGTCDWQAVELVEIWKVEKLSICKAL